MAEALSTPARARLNELYVTLNWLGEDVEGIDAWAVDRVCSAKRGDSA